MPTPPRFITAFADDRRLAAGAAAEVAVAVKRAIEAGETAQVLIFDDATGRLIDFDLRGGEADVAARLTPPEETRGRGRPKLGVVAREVTLLPCHWDWLAAQPGGASVALRRLVEAARRDPAARKAAARDAAYRVMAALAGDRAGFEEATRALFAGDRARLEAEIAAWPAGVRSHVLDLLDRSEPDD